MSTIKRISLRYTVFSVVHGFYRNIRISNPPFLPSINRPNAFFTIEFSQFLASPKAETNPNGTVLHDILPIGTVS